MPEILEVLSVYHSFFDYPQFCLLDQLKSSMIHLFARKIKKSYKKCHRNIKKLIIKNLPELWSALCSFFLTGKLVIFSQIAFNSCNLFGWIFLPRNEISAKQSKRIAAKATQRFVFLCVNFIISPVLVGNVNSLEFLIWSIKRNEAWVVSSVFNIMGSFSSRTNFFRRVFDFS